MSFRYEIKRPCMIEKQFFVPSFSWCHEVQLYRRSNVVPKVSYYVVVSLYFGVMLLVCILEIFLLLIKLVTYKIEI